MNSIQQDIETWKFIAEGLTYNHQQSVKDDILRKIEALEDELKNSTEDEQMLIGYLNRKIGYNGYCTAEIGTPVYAIRGQYMIEFIIEFKGTTAPMFYSKQELEPYINKINK
jgi:fumarate hydratase class II